jgi:hypothetical protein
MGGKRAFPLEKLIVLRPRDIIVIGPSRRRLHIATLRGTMRFLPTGPILPDELLEARDSGNVVFFCGAGVSRPAGLPGFFDLAAQVSSALGAPDGSASRSLLDHIRADPIFSPPLDQVFNLLQQEYGAAAIDDIVGKLLKTPRTATATAEQHAIVLRLSRSARRRPQVVTTNFDRLFEKADRSIKTHVPPALPDLASGQRLDGIVYLHGRSASRPTNGAARQGFVLSSADFGLAYLADGWATKFVRELLQNYVIVLLGYAANDPPVRYLLEGLHARGERAAAAIYAFDHGSDDEVHSRWRGRGVRPLPYEDSDGSHSALWDTLRSWADRADDPDAWRSTIVALARVGPRSLQPHERGQVASLVRTDRGAKLFADAEQPAPADWLCVFDRHVRYGEPRSAFGDAEEFDPLVQYGLDDDPPRPMASSNLRSDQETGDDLLLSAARSDAQVRLAAFGGRQTTPLPPRLFHLARWFGRLLSDPTSVWWAAGYTSLHETLLDQIEWRLERSGDEVEDGPYKVWSLLLQQFCRPPSVYGEDSWFRFAPALKRNGWTNGVIRDFEHIAKPYLRSKRPFHTLPPAPEASWQDLRLGDVVCFEVKFPLEHAGDFEIGSEELPRIFKILRRGLEHSAGLLADIGTRFWHTATFHPEQKAGEHYLDDKDRYLLRVVRLFDRLAPEHPDVARAEVQEWPKDDEFFFDKLTIYALMKQSLFSGHECSIAILSFSDRGFWNSYHRRELLHTLRVRWNDFSGNDRSLIEARIVSGRAPWEGEKSDEYPQRRAIDAATILGWLKQHNCKLSGATSRLLPQLRKADHRWRPTWDASADDSHEGRGGSVRVETDPSKISDAPLSELISRAQQHTTHPFQEFTEYQPFIGVVKERPLRAFSALSLEARHERYPTEFWRNALSNWPDDTPDRLRCLFGARVARLPSSVVSDLRYDIPRWLRTNLPKLAKVSLQKSLSLWDAVIAHFFALGPEASLSGIGDTFIGGKAQKRSRRTYQHSINSPIGTLSETLFEILDGLKLSGGAGVPLEIRLRLERLFAAPGDGADYAVCETTNRLRWLFYIDPEWVRHRIVPFFNLDDPRAEPAWNGYLHDNEMPVAELFALLKPYFLQVFPHSSAWDWDDAPIRRLNEFLVIGCYWNRKDNLYISYAEARKALQQAADEGRAHAIWFLANIVRDLNEWKKFGKPFIEKTWPRERKYQTSSSSRNFAHLAEEAGDHFPDVVKSILPLLGPVDHIDMLIYRAKKEGGDDSTSLVARFPEPMLALLDRVIPDDPRVGPHDLRSALNMIADAAPPLRQDERWRRLDAIAG